MVNVLWNIRFHALSTKLLWLRLLHFFGHQQRLSSGCAIGGQIHSGYDCEPSQTPTCGKALMHHLLLFTPFTRLMHCKSDSKNWAHSHKFFSHACTCADVVVDTLHGDGYISYSTTLRVPHHAFNPTMHLRTNTTSNAKTSSQISPHRLWKWTQYILHDAMYNLWVLVQQLHMFSQLSISDRLNI